MMDNLTSVLEEEAGYMCLNCVYTIYPFVKMYGLSQIRRSWIYASVDDEMMSSHKIEFGMGL